MSEGGREGGYFWGIRGRERVTGVWEEGFSGGVMWVWGTEFVEVWNVGSFIYSYHIVGVCEGWKAKIYPKLA